MSSLAQVQPETRPFPPAVKDPFSDIPPPDYALVARAAELFDQLRARAQENEDQRFVSADVADLIGSRGLFHIVVPQRHGGAGANFRTYIDAVAEIGRADGGTGWATALLNVCAWVVTLFPERAQKEVFSGGTLSRVCGVFAPSSTAEAVDGGYKVTGEWTYASGSTHAQWCTLGIPVGTDATGVPIPALALVPMSDITIKDVWHVAGMRASGSNTLIAKDIFIPDYRVQRFEDFATGQYGNGDPVEHSQHASFLPVAEIILVAVQIGLVRAAIDITLQKGATKTVSYTVFTQARQSPAHQIKLAEAVSDADQAYLLVVRACADIDRAARDRQNLDVRTRGRIRMDAGQAAKLCRDAINRLLSVNGAGSFALVNHLQRVWRDSEVASRHAFVLPEMASLIYGRALFGIEEIIQPF